MTNHNFTLATATLYGGSQSGIRTEQLMGRDHLVVPAVLVQGQILRNNMGVTLLPPDEITEQWAEEWNGVPVVIHEHPHSRGVSISAQSPEVLESRGVGYVFHVRAERNGTAQLKGEVWLDLSRVEEISELGIIVQRLRSGEQVELSTGFEVMLEETPGTHEGEAYESVLHPLGADHLAIFLDQKGACSLDHGCGLGVQASMVPPAGVENVCRVARRPTFSTTTEEQWRKPSLVTFVEDPWTELPTSRKQTIVATTLLGEVENTFSASMMFPVVDAEGRLNKNALDAVRSLVQNSTTIPKVIADSAFTMAGRLLEEEFDVDLSGTETERSMILKTIDKLAGFLGRKGESGGADPDDSGAANKGEPLGAEFRLLLRRLKAMGMTNDEIGVALDYSALAVSQIERGEILNPPAERLAKLKALIQQRVKNLEHEHSDEERRMLLSQAVESAFGGTDKIVWIDAVFSEEKQVVFGVVVENATGRKEQLFSGKFGFADDGEITFSDVVEVQRRTIYEPVGNTQSQNKREGDSTMKREELIATLVEAGPLGKDELTKLSDEQLQALQSAGEKPGAAKGGESGAAKGEPTAEQKAADEKKSKAANASTTEEEEAVAKAKAEKEEAAKKEQETQDEKIATLTSTVEKLEEATRPAVEERERERQTLVTELAANKQVPFDKVELEAKPVEELRKLRAMSRGEDYTASGGPQLVAVQSADEPQYLEPVAYFAKNKKEDGKKGDGNPE